MNILTNVKTIILGDIKKSSKKFLVTNDGVCGVYLIYIWIKLCKKFVFKIGKTVDITKRIIQLNLEHKSNNKIILLLYGKNNNSCIEKMFHDKMINFNMEHSNDKNKKSRELYYITSTCYYKILNLFEQNIPIFFKSNNYIINKDGTQYYKIFNDLLKFFNYSEITYINNIPFLKLYTTTNNSFWKINNLLYGKYIDSDCESDHKSGTKSIPKIIEIYDSDDESVTKIKSIPKVIEIYDSDDESVAKKKSIQKVIEIPKVIEIYDSDDENNKMVIDFNDDLNYQLGEEMIVEYNDDLNEIFYYGINNIVIDSSNYSYDYSDDDSLNSLYNDSNDDSDDLFYILSDDEETDDDCCDKDLVNMFECMKIK
jgi:hypothetical protein